MDRKLWFRAKRYGWGWYPVSWQGWLVLLAYLAVIVPIALTLNATEHSVSDLLINFSLPYIGLTSLLLSICYLTGEMPGWRWGNSASSRAGLHNAGISPIIRKKAPIILREIKKANSILLHCHPSPDPDSVGSALAMKYALEQMGKKATVIRGDSEIPQAFMHFPGAKDIVQKNFFEIDLKDFDLFIIQDSGSKEMISRYKPIELPLPIRTIVIDHHASNPSYGDVNLVEPGYPAACKILFDLFTIWRVRIGREIAENLFIGLYSDTGGFKYDGTTERTFYVAGELIKVIPNFTRLISDMENSNKPMDIAFQALALGSVETFLNGTLAISVISNAILKEKGIPLSDVNASAVSPVLRTVAEWKITGTMVETEPNNIKMSFRSKDADLFDVSKLAVALGGGGHKAAAGATLNLPLSEAKKLVVTKAKELYNL